MMAGSQGVVRGPRRRPWASTSVPHCRLAHRWLMRPGAGQPVQVTVGPRSPYNARVAILLALLLGPSLEATLVNSPEFERPMVLVVEDDSETAKVIHDLLVGEGYGVGIAPDGATALARLDADQVDVVLLDLMLPDVSGLDVCQQVRGR